MESLGYAFAILIWGFPLAALLVGTVAAGAVTRWGRRTISGLEEAERLPYSSGVPQPQQPSPSTNVSPGLRSGRYGRR
jgi:hypothetical protein